MPIFKSVTFIHVGQYISYFNNSSTERIHSNCLLLHKSLSFIILHLENVFFELNLF